MKFVKECVKKVIANECLKKVTSLLLATLIIFTSTPWYAFAAEAEVVDSVESSANGAENGNSGITSNEEGVGQEQTSGNQNSGVQDSGGQGNNSQPSTSEQDPVNTQTQESSKQEVAVSSNEGAIMALSDDNEISNDSFKIALRWGGTSNKEYNWDATKSENRVIKLTFYYQNEVSKKAYAPGDLVVTIPGIGNLNRTSTVKVKDIAADVYGSTEHKRDWSYKYDSSTDTYTFYNNNEIEQGSTFNGSFEMLWEFSSRNCINEYTQYLQAKLSDGEETVTSQELTLHYTSERDTFYINKTAKAMTSADGLSKYVAEGKTVSDYAWVQYTFRYNVQTLNARALKSRYFIDTLPEGCVIAKNTNVIQNEDGTISYKIQETSVPENSVREYSVVVGYPEEYIGQTIENTVYLHGTYKDETEDTLLAESTIEVQLERMQNRVVGIVSGKNMSPDYVYTEALEGDINFSASLYATTTTNLEDAGYTVTITDDLLEIYTPANEDGTKEAGYHTLSDDEYKFTSITVPGKNNFVNANGYTLSDGDYTVKIYALYKKDVNTRALSEYTLLYEGAWNTSSITQTISEDAVAIRVEVSGLTESIKSFYITTKGVINVSENVENSEYENPSYIINYDFTELKDKNGNSLIPEITKENYSQQRLYERDTEIYGTGLLRSNDTIQIKEYVEPTPSTPTPTPGYYYAYANIEPFAVDENVEYFTTNLSHKTTVNNNETKEITKVEVHGVTEKEELETLIETIQLTYSGLTFKNALSNDVDMQEYLKQRATITTEGNEVSVTFDFLDLCQVFRHIFSRIFINFSSFA